MDCFFKEYVGDNYSKGGIMLLGEAHICGLCSPDDCLLSKDDNCIGGHCRLVEKQMSDGINQTYKNFEKLFTGSDIIDNKEREVFWHQFLFTNYLAIAMPNGRKAPKAKFYTDDCSERLINLVKKYQPSYILIWGDRTWNHLPGDEESGMWKKKYIAELEGFDIWVLDLDNNEIVKVLKILHPSNDITEELYILWNKRINFFLQH